MYSGQEESRTYRVQDWRYAGLERCRKREAGEERR